MNEKNTGVTPEAEEPKAGVPQDVADGVAQLAADVSRLERGAARGWKITAVVLFVLLAVIAGYLKFFVYNVIVVGFTDPIILVQTGMGLVDQALGAAGAPKLDSGQLPRWVADEVKNAAPMVMEQHVKPQVQNLIAQLPQRRSEILAWLKDRLPDLLDEQVRKLPNQYLPQAREEVVKRVAAELDRILDQADEQFGRVVDEVITSIGREDIEILKEEGKLEEAFADAFEERLGPYLDEVVFWRIDRHVTSATEAMENLVATRDKTLEEQLDIRIIQLVRVLFEQAGEAPPTTGWVMPAGMPANERRVVRKAIQQGLAPSAAGDGTWVIPEGLPEEELATLRKAIEDGLVPPPRGGVEALDKIETRGGDE